MSDYKIKNANVSDKDLRGHFKELDVSIIEYTLSGIRDHISIKKMQ
jgi:hypothetical protein